VSEREREREREKERERERERARERERERERDIYMCNKRKAGYICTYTYVQITYVHIQYVNFFVYIYYRRHKADERGTLLHRHHLHHALKYLKQRKGGQQEQEGGREGRREEGRRGGRTGARKGANMRKAGRET
jgi:hypothetical protein